MLRAAQLPITTAADESFTGYLPVTGQVFAVFVDGVGGAGLSTPDITITDDATGAEILAVTGLATDKRYQPRVLVQDKVGADIAATYAPPCAAGRIKVVVAGGGATKSGSVTVLFDAAPF